MQIFGVALINELKTHVVHNPYNYCRYVIEHSYYCSHNFCKGIMHEENNSSFIAIVRMSPFISARL